MSTKRKGENAMESYAIVNFYGYYYDGYGWVLGKENAKIYHSEVVANSIAINKRWGNMLRFVVCVEKQEPLSVAA